jgi:hypothetical protein
MPLPGPIAFCDAAFNPAVDGNVAGLGIYLVNPQNKNKLFISVVSSLASSVLLNPMRFIWLLKCLRSWSGPMFLFYSDCKILVEAGNRDNMLSKESHWLIRPSLADIIAYKKNTDAWVLKVPHAENKIAHALAKHTFQD